METILIVDYHAQYAKAIADMWNRSSSGWMGRSWNSSEAKVLHHEGKDSYHNLYLAVQGELVLGYAKLSKYSEEKDVAYIDLLSVDPEYHGKGIGRDLVKQCVLRAAELGYERIDLFTWAGNTKAVPLYKKCGFFWEKMETQTTHLMNFLPGLLNNELLKPYFEYFHWYDDNKRELLTEPDGRKVNGFDIFDYIWEKDGKRLAISFERCGRGIVAITTPDFSIAVDIATAKPVFGDNYKVQYKFTNHTAKPVELKLKGLNDDVIQYGFKLSETVIKDTTCEADFFIAPLKRTLSEWETCPGLRTKLSLKGKELLLKTGLFVQYPLSVNLRTQSSLVTPGRQEVMYLNVHNHFPVACAYHILLPEEAPLTLLQKSFEIGLQADEKAFIPISYIADGAIVYNPSIKVTASPEGGKKLEFTVECSTTMAALNSMSAKNMQEMISLLNGQYSVYMLKTTNKNWGGFNSIYGSDFNFAPPQIGLPYSEEFDTEPPYDIQIKELGSAQQLTMKFRSKDNANVDFGYIYTLYPTGLMELRLKVYAIPEPQNQYYAQLKLGFNEQGVCFEQAGHLVQLEDDFPQTYLNAFARDCLTGNWIFSKTDDSTSAIIWDPLFPAKLGSYWLIWEMDMAQIMAKENGELLVASMYLDVFRNSYQVRNAALGYRKELEYVQPTLELMVNEGNPILSQPYQVKLIQHQDKDLCGSYQLETMDGNPLADLQVTGEADNIREIRWEIAELPQQALTIIQCKAVLSGVSMRRSQLCLKGGGEISVVNKDKLLLTDNGCISISTATDAVFPGLISLQYKGVEFLEPGYPDYMPKSYYNRYHGGISIAPMQIRGSALIQETHAAGSITVQDQFGNLWQGLAITTTVHNFEPLKGLVFRQCYVMHPGVPVLVLLTELIQNNGWAQFVAFNCATALKHEENKQDAMLLLPKPDKQWLSISAGSKQVNAGDFYYHMAAKNPQTEAYLQWFHLSRCKHTISMDNAIVRDTYTFYNQISEHGRSWLQPQFMLFSEHLYGHESLSALLSLKFTEV